MAEAGRRFAALLAAITVLAEIAYPLMHGTARSTLTITTVVTFFLASATSALATRGLGWTALFVLITAGGGFLAEAVGVASGLPFGRYAYTGSLGPELAGVPLIIPLAWTMMGYPAFVVAGRLVSGRLVSVRIARAVVTGWALASWDLFLDPQMVDAGNWRWAHPHPGLPGVPHVPLTNYAGWLAVAMTMGLLLAYVLPEHRPAPGGVPVALYLWTYASSVLAHAAFFDLPGSALWGGAAMGLVALPVAWRLIRDRRT